MLEQQQQQLLDELQIQQPQSIAELDQKEETDSHPQQPIDEKGNVQEFSITENEEDLPGNLPDALPSQTDLEGLEYSASGIDAPASFDGRS